ncbi:family 1 glycosylhydrolase [Dactylosporangium sp. NBC_01737]|uniref:glycoside hydrolase family 1 protein n=1 Tax=Dactylosporangium sp. NBC_01737 TaxID=2975959 RepID=UPI002E150D68|nr:family 1 glycosylhydrolase [Dactylosporangium sp. NBC_01737]
MRVDGQGSLNVPPGFLWGASTAAHQVEGGNVGNDWWEAENASPPFVPERSGDACDSYHRYGEDIAIVADAGLNAYRFSLEWSRIEPSPGHFSRAALDHYRRMIDACLARGVTPVVTLHHFTMPQWFVHAGHWTAPDAADLFARYCSFVLPILREGVPWAFTINEPNIHAAVMALRAGATVPNFLPPPAPPVVEGLIAAHRAARAVLADVPGLRTGWTVANLVMQPAAPEHGPAADAMRWTYEDQFLAESTADDVVGVQCYSRLLIGASGVVPPVGAATTQMGWEYYPAALGLALRHVAAQSAGTPMLVTENGIATADDEERIRYTRGALTGLAAALHDGLDVRGYLHWSLLDNFEWAEGYRPTFGLVAVDRTTFARTPKPSLRWLGSVARTGELE